MGEQIINLIITALGFGTKLIKPDTVRERESKIEVVLKQRKVNERVEKQDKIDWKARVRTFDLKKVGKGKTITNRELIKYVEDIIEWGAEIEDIRKTETEIQVDYIRDGICYPTEIFKL